MIVRPRPGRRVLVDREALALDTGLAEVTIRTHLRAIEYDRGTGRALYDLDDAHDALSKVVAQPLLRGTRRRDA